MRQSGIAILAMEYPPFLRGGLGTHVATLTRELAGRGIPVYIFAFSPEPLPPQQEGNITVFTVSTDSGDYSRYSRNTLELFYSVINERLYQSAKNFFNTKRLIPSVIHCHDFHGYPASAKLRDLLQVPLICTIHLLHEPLMRWGGEEPPRTHVEMERLMCTGADHLIVVCNGFRDLIRERYPTSAVPIHLVHNGINGGDWAPNSGGVALKLRTDLELADDVVIAFAGRFTAQKSVVEIINSASAILANHRNVTYLFAGYFENAEYARAVRSALKQISSGRNKLRFLGKLSAQEVREVYAVTDIALVPSVYEGVPYSALEAMASRIPVIASDTCGISDLIDHGSSGLLVPLVKSESDSAHQSEAHRLVDVASLVSAQLQLLEDHVLASSLAENGQARVISQFTIEKMVEQTIHVYNDA